MEIAIIPLAFGVYSPSQWEAGRVREGARDQVTESSFCLLTAVATCEAHWILVGGEGGNVIIHSRGADDGAVGDEEKKAGKEDECKGVEHILSICFAEVCLVVILYLMDDDFGSDMTSAKRFSFQKKYCLIQLFCNSFCKV